MDRRRLIAAAGGTLLFTLAPWQIASGAQLVNVRMWPAEEYTRVTIETDEALKFKHFFVRSATPLRLVIDIEGLVLTERVRKLIADVKPDDPYIAAMRIGQFKPGILRLVMDLKTDVKPEVFLLKPFANYKYRLVFDIYPARPKDVIGEILAGGDESGDSLLPVPEPVIGDDADDPAGSADPLADMIASLTAPKPAAKPAEAVPPAEPKEAKPAAAPAPAKPAAPARSSESGAKKPAAAPAREKPAEKPKAEPKSQSGSKKSAAAAAKPAQSGVITIVVDPGHGGEDPGAIGQRKTQEKDVVLAIARRLVKLISAERGMKAVMTRNSDHFVSLGGRVAIARRVKAHLLVSIHADAWVKRDVRGSSVFALSQKGATSAAARWLAKNQNESDLIGGVNISSVNRQVATVLVDMTSSWTIGYSLGLGAAVLNELRGISKLHKTKVEQAGFAVLKGQGIPSILVETAFISNPTEEKLLKSASHQQKIAQAILRGIKKQLAQDKSLLEQG